MTDAKYQHSLFEVPELSWCIADGTMHHEAVSDALTSIQQWLGTAQSLGREIPTPRGKLSYA